MTTELNDLNIDPRAYKYIRETAIRNVYDAVLETVTNSADAYNRSSLEFKEKKIDVNFSFENKTLRVTDNATGLTSSQMEQYFLNVGSYTSSSDTRGYFSRGAKDLCSLGDVTFTAIKEGKKSVCFINHQAKGQIQVADVDVTAEDRALLGIPENGLSVQIDLLSTIEMNRDQISSLLQNHYGLRDIFSSSDYNVGLYYENVFQKKLVYEYPEGEKIIDLEYDLTELGYPTKAYFTLYKANEAQEDHNSELLTDDFNKFGFLISSGVGLHENTTFHHNVRYNPNITRLYGKLECPYIMDLLYQHDTDMTAEQLEKNPYPIITPSRQNGLLKSHPFTKALFSVPYNRLLYVLNEMEDTDNSYSITESSINSLLNQIEIFAEESMDIIDNSYLSLVDTQVLLKYINRDDDKLDVKEDDSLEYSSKNMNININPEGNIKVRPKFRIKFTKEDMNYKYLLYKDMVEGLILKISVNHIGLKKYVTYTDTKIEGLEKIQARIILATIIVEALARLILDNELEAKKISSENIKTSMRRYEIIVNKIEPQIYNTLVLSNNTTTFV